MKKVSLKQQAYEFIKAKIINCEYPPSSFINEEMLREEIGASRTPIREALTRLEQENLVKILPKKGIMIADVSMKEINMIYEARLLIEPYIIITYGTQLDKDALFAMRQDFINQKKDTSQTMSSDDSFHQLLIDTCPNRYLKQTYEQTYNQNRRLRILSGNNIERRLIESLDEHILIIDHLLQEDFQQAAVYMRRHLESARSAAFRLLVLNGGGNL